MSERVKEKKMKKREKKEIERLIYKTEPQSAT